MSGRRMSGDTDDLHSHHIGLRRPYCAPSRSEMRPNKMKSAATSGDGAMIVTQSLCVAEVSGIVAP